MGISVSAAYDRARELRQQARNLRAVKNSMATYKNIINASWEGNEVKYYRQAITSIQNRLNSTADSLDSLAGSIETTANQIRAEEIEAERRYQEWLAEQERLRKEEEEAARASSTVITKN